jgi:hypothetical protein
LVGGFCSLSIELGFLSFLDRQAFRKEAKSLFEESWG